MCNKQFQVDKRIMQPLAVKLAKISAVLIFFCFAECAAGSCLSYGHACWGAHGKRSGSHNNIVERETAPVIQKGTANTRWVLSRLVNQPLDLRYEDLKIPVSQRDIEQQLSADIQLEMNPVKGFDDYENMASLEENDFLDNNVNAETRKNRDKIKSSRFLKKRSASII